MPNVDDMFPSKYISYKDLEPGISYTGTIHSVQIEAARGGSGIGGNPGFTGRPGQAVEADWIMWLKEWAKPFKLKPAKARLLAAMFGSKNTEDWAGRVVTFYRGTTVIGNEPKDSINIDDRPQAMLSAKPGPAAPALASSQAPPRKPLLLDPARAKVLIPIAALDRFRAKLADYERTWTDFLAWLKTTSPEGHDLIIGRSLEEIPGSVLPAMGVYLEHLAKPPAPPPPAVPDGAKPITEDDIPF